MRLPKFRFDARSTRPYESLDASASAEPGALAANAFLEPVSITR